MQSASSVSSHRTRIADSLAGSGASGSSAAAAGATVTAPAPSGRLQTAATPEAAATGRAVAPLPASLPVSSVLSASALRTDAVAPGSHSPVRDRKVEQTAAELPSFKDLMRSTGNGVRDAIDHFSPHYRSASGAAQPGETFEGDRKVVVKALRQFLDVLPQGAEKGRMVVKLTVRCALFNLNQKRIGAASLRSFWRDICIAMSEAGVPPSSVAPALESEIMGFTLSEHHAGSSLFLGLVDAIEQMHLRGTFESRDVDARTREVCQLLADLAIRLPLLATALGDLRLRHEPQTRRLGMPMDYLGQCIAERARTASVTALRVAAEHITSHSGMGAQGKEGFDRWRYSLEPYFRGSLANEDKRAAEGVVSAAVGLIDVWMAILSLKGVPQSSDAHRLNLDDMSAAFMAWMSEAPRAQREQIHLYLAQALAKMNAPSRPTQPAAVER